MGKFKVGDEVKVISPFRKLEIGDVLKIVEVDELDIHGLNYLLANDKKQDWGREIDLELVKSKQTKKQRIETLEKEVSELKLIVHELREHKPSVFATLEGQDLEAEYTEQVKGEPSTDKVIEFEGAKYRKVDRKAREGDVVAFGDISTSITEGKLYKVILSESAKKESIVDDYGFKSRYIYFGSVFPNAVYELIEQTIVEDEPKTPNQLRAEVIEKAKGFVESRRLKNHTFKQAPGQIRAGEILTYDDVYEVPSRIHKLSEYVGVCKVKFIVNTEKRTIVALFYGATSNRLFTKGIAKCNPSDVFNEHIGKAIALGRALGLDVSEFEQAVQPTNYAIGQIGINETLGGKYPFEIIEIGKGDVFRKQFEPFTTSYGDTIHPLGFEDETTKALLIINDTNAIYGGVE